MQSLLRFLLRNYFFILFLVFEGLSFALLVQHHRDGGRFISSASAAMGSFYKVVDAVFGYIDLKTVNEQLAQDNARLLSVQPSAMRVDTACFRAKNDTIEKQQYDYLAANVINNTIHKSRNFITLDKGSSDGVQPDMGLITPQGAVGVVVGVSKHYALAISLLNVDFGLSGMLQKTGYFGAVAWQGRRPTEVLMSGIPSHAKLTVGDSVVTSGFSAIFPRGVLIGRVASIEPQPGTKLVNAQLVLSEDMARLRQVYLVRNLFRNEQIQLEELAQ